LGFCSKKAASPIRCYSETITSERLDGGQNHVVSHYHRHAWRTLAQKRGVRQLHPKAGGIGINVIGGLIFGVGFATLGYCPASWLAQSGTGP
jgi:hypothetical protein